MGKYGRKPEQVKQDTHPRLCRKCGKRTYSWSCCGQQTARVNDKAFTKNRLSQNLGDKADYR